MSHSLQGNCGAVENTHPVMAILCTLATVQFSHQAVVFSQTPLIVPFLRLFSRYREKRILAPSCLSVYLSACVSVPIQQICHHWEDVHDIDILSLSKIFRKKLKFNRNLTRNMCTLFEDIRTYTVLSKF